MAQNQWLSTTAWTRNDAEKRLYSEFAPERRELGRRTRTAATLMPLDEAC